MADFIASLNKDQKESVERIVGILQEWGDKQSPPRKVDIELLLEALQTLSNKEQEILIPFIKNPQLKILNIDPSALLTLLHNFIKKKVIVEIDKINYLEHLRAFIQEYSPLDIYSANYDTCIELFCSEHKLHYKDGFDEAWNPKVFDDENIDIRLFKIHGSIMWYQSDRGRFLKIPLRTNDDTVELITKERAKGLMLYPAQKFEYVEPLFELLMEMKRRLDRCKILFVVGYSFRDEHVRRIFWDIARKNKEFRIVLIGPDSWKIYQDRLKYYDDGKTLSHLSEKVVCIPFKFESVLHVLKTEFLRNLQFSHRLINEQIANEMAGHYTNWQHCLASAASCGDIESLKLIFKKISINEIDRIGYQDAVTSLLHGLFYAIGSQDQKVITDFWVKFKKVLIFPSRLNIQVSPITSLISFNLNTPLAIAPTDIHRILENFGIQMRVRKQWLKNEEIVNGYLDMLDQILKILSIWAAGSVSFEDYLTARKAYSSGLQDTFNNLLDDASVNKINNERMTKAIHAVTEIEKKEIQAVIDSYDEILF